MTRRARKFTLRRADIKAGLRRAVMVELVRYDWLVPQTICYRTLPFLARNSFNRRITAMQGAEATMPLEG
jgi:hypothetical protein